MKKITLILSGILFGCLVHSANAQTPGVDQRQAVQHERIREGVASGELTRSETATAVHQQGHIRRAERRANADGHVSHRERARLRRMQNKSSRDLRRNKHDAQARPKAK